MLEKKSEEPKISKKSKYDVDCNKIITNITINAEL